MASICVFGDSIAWGAYDPVAGGWVTCLRNHFEKSGIEVYNLGISGDSTNELLKRFEAEARARQPSVIIIAIGTNDSERVNGKYLVPPKRFESNLKKLISLARKFTKNIIFISPIRVDESKTKPIPWEPSICYYNNDIEIYAKIISKVCKKKMVRYIDIMGIMNKKDMYDGLHPNTKGHMKIFQKGRVVLEKFV